MDKKRDERLRLEKKKKPKVCKRKVVKTMKNRDNEKEKMSIFAKESDVRDIFLAKRQIYVLLYKDVYLSTNDLNNSMPSLVTTLL